jgi:Domain of unknown function (DUF1902)
MLRAKLVFMNLSKPNTYTIEVQLDEESGQWCCECDALHLVTEAPSYEALVARAKLLAPDIAAANDIDITGAQLRFEQLVYA